MRTLVYKRTHSGDPDLDGRFGINDCMGTVRARKFEAVIGIGGTGPEPRRSGIAEKITWVGIGPHRFPGTPRGPLVLFDHFLYFGERGPSLIARAPTLAAHVYGLNVRSLMTFSPEEAVEVENILALAVMAPPSSALGTRDSASPGTRRIDPEMPSVGRPPTPDKISLKCSCPVTRPEKTV